LDSSKKHKSKKIHNLLSVNQVPLTTLRRLPYYYNIICDMESQGFKYVSSANIAKQLGIDDTLVRKDIAATGYMGKPKVGFNTTEFKIHLEEFLGMKKIKSALLIGAGHLGIALARYQGFKRYGLEIIAIFDKDPEKIGNKIGDKEIFPIHKLENTIKKKNVQMAILAIPADNLSEVTESLIKNGIKAIWNFTGVHLNVPTEVFVWNEDLAASFITLSQFTEPSNT
jgi:redox-sensing transcriptional repressor